MSFVIDYSDDTNFKEFPWYLLSTSSSSPFKYSSSSDPGCEQICNLYEQDGTTPLTSDFIKLEHLSDGNYRI